jgi:hypothetical protein
MDETSIGVRKILQKKYTELTWEQRISLGFQSCETAKSIVIFSFPKDLAKEEILIRLFLKYYNNDFSEEEKNIIIKHFKNFKYLILKGILERNFCIFPLIILYKNIYSITLLLPIYIRSPQVVRLSSV